MPEAAQLAHHPEIDVLGHIGGIVRVAHQPERAVYTLRCVRRTSSSSAHRSPAWADLDELPVDLHLGPLPTFS